MNIRAEVVNVCQKTKQCVMQDDADAIVYYEMCGQLKTLPDRYGIGI